MSVPHAGGGTQVILVVIRKQQIAGKGTFLHIVAVRVQDINFTIDEILEKRVCFSAVSYRHLMYEFQRHEILL